MLCAVNIEFHMQVKQTQDVIISDSPALRVMALSKPDIMRCKEQIYWMGHLRQLIMCK